MTVSISVSVSATDDGVHTLCRKYEYSPYYQLVYFIASRLRLIETVHADSLYASSKLVLCTEQENHLICTSLLGYDSISVTEVSVMAFPIFSHTDERFVPRTADTPFE